MKSLKTLSRINNKNPLISLQNNLIKNFSSLNKFSSKKLSNDIYSNFNKAFLYKSQYRNFFGKKEKKEEAEKKEEEKKEEEIKPEEEEEKGKKEEKETKKEKTEDVVSIKKYNELKTLLNESEDNLNKARTKFDELRKAYLDSQHDLERIRKRSETEIANAKEFSISKFAKDILDVYDNFERALDTIKPNEEEGNKEEAEETEEKSEVEILKEKLKKHEDFAEGIVMTKSSLIRILAFHSVKEYNPLNEKFNPNIHEAVCQVPSFTPEQTPGTVASVMQTGFMIGTRVLRPAKVAVVKK